MTTRPTMIQHTQRQRITTKSGVELERAYLFMNSECWAQLTALCHAQGRSSSEVIQSLVKIAAIGHLKDNDNDKDTIRSN